MISIRGFQRSDSEVLFWSFSFDLWRGKNAILNIYLSCRLEAGKAYYVEVLQKQKYKLDHVEVAVIFFPKWFYTNFFRVHYARSSARQRMI